MGPNKGTIHSTGNVYLDDFGNDHNQKFDSNGKFITKWGTPGNGDGQLGCPIDIALDSK